MSAPLRSGYGIVRLRGGDSYEGEYEIDGVWLTLRGRCRNLQASGEFFYSTAGVWTFPGHRVLVIADRERVAV
jgi:hypothetical protein